MARKYWPNEDPLGKVVRIPDRNGPQAQVVGIARDGKYGVLAESPQPFLYRPFAQGRRVAMTLVVLAKGEAAAVASDIRAAVQAVDPAVPMFDVRTMDDLYRSRALLPSRITSQLVSALGVLALVLASVGLYGVMAFVSARRTREIAVRVAVGATARTVVLLVLRQAAAPIAPGLVLGLALAAALTPLISSPTFDFVTANDPLVFASVPMVIVVVALIASAMPAVRAARVDPATLLRAD
jgi:ABC-type antimicrobial peptide transport system permease subunit